MATADSNKLTTSAIRANLQRIITKEARQKNALQITENERLVWENQLREAEQKERK